MPPEEPSEVEKEISALQQSEANPDGVSTEDILKQSHEENQEEDSKKADTVAEGADDNQERNDGSNKLKELVSKLKTLNIDKVLTGKIAITTGLLIILILLALLANHNALSSPNSFYSGLGMTRTDGLAFTSFKVEKNFEDQHIRFVVNSKIANESEEAREIPPIRVQVLTGAGRTMKEDNIPIENNIIQPGEKIAFDVEIIASGKADRLVFDIGNGWEKFYR